MRRRAFISGLAAAAAWPFDRGMAQAPADAVFGVTALDVAPRSAAQGVDLLVQYRGATRPQAANLGTDVLQEIGWPNRFVIYEAWRDRAAYDANEKGAALAELREMLKAVAAAPYDRRDQRAVSVGARKAATAPGAVYLQVHLDVFPPGIAAMLNAVKELADAARRGDGNLHFDVVQSIKPPASHTTLYGGWASREAFDAFERSAYGRRYRDTIGPLLGSPYDDRLYAMIG